MNKQQNQTKNHFLLTSYWPFVELKNVEDASEKHLFKGLV